MKTIDMQISLNVNFRDVPYDCDPDELAKELLSKLGLDMKIKGISLGNLSDDGNLNDIVYAGYHDPSVKVFHKEDLINEYEVDVYVADTRE